MSANTVKCSNCTHHTQDKTMCSVWNRETMRKNITRKEMSNLFHNELGSIEFTNVDSMRYCKHFSGQYPFTVGE